MDIISIPLGWLLRVIYQLVDNYGVAIILFTLITKFLLFPLTLKQQKSLAQTQLIKPEIDALQKKYANDREKFSTESMKLYKKYGISPFSGCLPMLIQLPIIFALYYVIREPLSYIWGSWGNVPDGINVAKLIKEFGLKAASGSEEIALTAFFSKHLKDVGEYAQYAINYNLLGLDLSETPQISKPALVWIVPALAGLSTWLSTKISTISTKKKEDETTPKRPPRPDEKDPAQTTNTMMMIMPFMTVWFAFMLPAGVGLYWIASNIFQMGQQFALNKYYVPKIRERMAIENEELDSARKGRKKPGRSN